MRTIIDNLINGNCTDAKQGAKRHPWEKLFKFLRDDIGYTEEQARATADFLKGRASFQHYCEATRDLF